MMKIVEHRLNGNKQRGYWRQKVQTLAQGEYLRRGEYKEAKWKSVSCNPHKHSKWRLRRVTR